MKRANDNSVLICILKLFYNPFQLPPTRSGANLPSQKWDVLVRKQNCHCDGLQEGYPSSVYQCISINQWVFLQVMEHLLQTSYCIPFISFLKFLRCKDSAHPYYVSVYLLAYINFSSNSLTTTHFLQRNS